MRTLMVVLFVIALFGCSQKTYRPSAEAEGQTSSAGVPVSSVPATSPSPAVPGRGQAYGTFADAAATARKTSEEGRPR